MAAPITRDIDGKTWEFPVLTPAEVIHISKKLYDAERKQLLEDFEASGVDADRRFDELRKLDERRELVSTFFAGMFRVEGATMVLECSAGKAKEKPPYRDMDMDEWPWLALDVCNIKVERKAESEGGEDDDLERNPTDGETA